MNLVDTGCPGMELCSDAVTSALLVGTTNLERDTSGGFVCCCIAPNVFDRISALPMESESVYQQY